MKFIATVHQTNSGFWFIDRWSECYGTIYTWCWNERAREAKEYDDPYKLARPKYKMTREPLMVVSEDRMLENHAHAEEQVFELEHEGFAL